MKRVTWIAVLVVLCTIPLFSQELSLNQAIALARNTSTISENATLQLQKQLNKTQINTYLPSITLSLGGSATGSIVDSSYDVSITPTAGVAFSLSNTNSYTDDEQILLYKLAQQTYMSTLENLDSQVTTAYWNVVAANLALQIQELELQNKQGNLERTREKYEGGLSTTLEVSQAELALSNAQLAVQKQTQALDSAKQTLEDLIGSSFSTTSDELLQPSSLKPMESLLDLVMQTTSVKTLELDVETANLAYAQKKQSIKSPTLSLNASTTFSGTLALDRVQLRDATTLSVSLSLPLDSYLPNSSAQITLDNLDKDITIAKNTLEEGIRTLESNVKHSYLAIEQALSSLSYLESYKTVAEKNHELTITAYEAGEVDYATLKESENALNTAALSILSQQVNYTLALYDLSYLLETDISTLMQ